MWKFVSLEVISILLLVGVTVCSSAQIPCDPGRDPFDPDDDLPPRRGNDDFDHLILAQLWPVTECFNWKARNPRNTCNMPRNANIFTIHGLWPSLTGTYGPTDCRSNEVFYIARLNGIINDLRERWTDIHGGSREGGFWRYEWRKHGTCAQVLRPLNNVPNYFQRTLQLHRKYDIFDALGTKNIRPGGTYRLGDIEDAIIARFRVVPRITYSPTRFGRLLNEIRLCFDKSLELINCARRCNENLDLTVNYLRDVPT